MSRTSEIVAATDAMRQKRQELIAQPLSMIWVQIARAGIEAAERMREQERRENCKHPYKRGTGYACTDGSSEYSWYCPECGTSGHNKTPPRSSPQSGEGQ